MPPQYYIKLADWKGGLRYLNWFYKNFPDDSGFPDLLLELAIILFKSGKIKEAGKMIFEALNSNIYIIDKYFGRPIVPIEKYESSNLGLPEYLKDFTYRSENPDLKDFSDWLDNFTNKEKFVEASKKFVNIQKLLQNDDNREMRVWLIDQARKLEVKF
ncbi:tetratricopeptide repeat protein [Chryseobacterium sp. TY4]